MISRGYLRDESAFAGGISGLGTACLGVISEVGIVTPGVCSGVDAELLVVFGMDMNCLPGFSLESLICPLAILVTGVQKISSVYRCPSLSYSCNAMHG